jgi:hypothetical protein
MARPRGHVLLPALALAAATLGCRRASHAHVSTFHAPEPPAGFVAHSATGWRIAVPSTWHDGPPKDGTVWSASDPQAAEAFHANVNVHAETFTGQSYDYARANEAALRRDPRATVELVQEDVVDGDPTLVLETTWNLGPPPAAPFHTIQTALSARGMGYVVTCAASTAAFERYRSTCGPVVRSFAIER